MPEPGRLAVVTGHPSQSLRVDDMSFSTLKIDRHGHVLVITIDNPASDLNVVDEHLHRDFAVLFRTLRDERHARCILLTGSKKAFCAGGDFAWFTQLRTVEALEGLRRDAKSLIWDLLDIATPIVCALNGPAMGLGASIALLCDSIVMAATARIGDPHIKVGIVAGDGGTAIWPLAVGPALAKRYLLTGDALDANTALRLGLVTDVVEPDQLDDYAMALAQRIAAQAPLAVQYTKAAVNQSIKQTLATSFDAATNSEIVTLLSSDHREALLAMSERRPPVFEGK